MNALTGWIQSRKVAAKPRTLPPPRNAAALIDYRRQGLLSDHDDGVVVSYVGQTPIDAPHVFVDSGRQYDWSALAGLSAYIVVTKGIDARLAIVDLCRCSELGKAPHLIDFEAKLLAWIVSHDPITLLPQRRGSSSWVNLFS